MQKKTSKNIKGGCLTATAIILEELKMIIKNVMEKTEFGDYGNIHELIPLEIIEIDKKTESIGIKYKYANSDKYIELWTKFKNVNLTSFGIKHHKEYVLVKGKSYDFSATQTIVLTTTDPKIIEEYKKANKDLLPKNWEFSMYTQIIIDD